MASPINFKKIGPLQQGGFTVLLITIATLVSYVCGFRSILAWNMVVSPIFFFCCYNPIIGAFQEKWPRYMVVSILVFLTLGMYIYISGNFVSDLSFGQSEELQRIAVLAVIFYILLNLLCLMFRGVLYLLEHVDE